MIVVEQLNRAQWHAVRDDGLWFTGVADYVSVLSHALIVSSLDGDGVETVNIDGARLILAREAVRHG